MCGGGGGGDGGAAAREKERQARIQANVDGINQAFTGYNDDYYNGVYNDTLSYYTPEVDRQYQDARKQATLALAKQGILSSDAGAEQLRKIEDTYKRGQSDAASRAMQARQDAMGTVERQRSTLLSQAQGGNNMDAGAIQAASDAARFAGPSGNLGSLFGDVLSNIAAAGQGYTAGKAASGGSSLWFANPLSSGGYKTVG